MEKILLFVYGTLLTGEGNWSWALAPQKGEGDSLNGACLYHLGGFPGMLKSSDKGNSVVGEVFEITEEKLRRIDSLEGYQESNPENSMYIREKVHLFSGKEAFTYFYNPYPDEELKQIVSGDWRNK